MSQEKQIDENKICFIVCSNNDLYLEECLYYISKLKVPEHIKIETLSVTDALSMTAGYNEGMQHSNAKYKVYLHQDTFIVNPNFIYDCLRIFKMDSSIGMIGNIGAKVLPDSGIMWEGERIGKLYEQHIYETVLLYNWPDGNVPFVEVEAVDGFIMATQDDLPWRDDIFTAWDFYDISQSREFINHGYKVVVPNMDKPWCLHDCGFVNLKNYGTERKKFLKEYKNKI